MEKAVILLLLAWLLRRRQRRRETVRHRKYKTRPVFRKRSDFGEMRLIRELYEKDDHIFRKCFRMQSHQFDYIVNRVGAAISKSHESWKDSIDARQRLAMTLRFLATGDAITTIAISYCIGITTAWKIIFEVCAAIWNTLSPEYLKVPNKKKWLEIAEDYNNICQFPLCVGAIDGKHVGLQAPCNSGSDFYNYKHFHSIVLMAMCDARHCFTIVDIGACGRESDGGVFARSTFGKMFTANKLDIPASAELPGSLDDMPFVAVADAAFPLRANLMKPFGGKGLSKNQMIFNYRLSRARITIENTFGILATRWRMFRRTIAASPSRVETYAKATFVLHNYLQRSEGELPASQRIYCPPGYVDSVDANGTVISGQWRLETDGNLIPALNNRSSNRHSFTAAAVRNKFVEYFVGAGQVKWQNSATFGTE